MRPSIPSVLVLTIGCCQACRGEEWAVAEASARVPLTIHTGFHPRRDEVVEVPLAKLPTGAARVFMNREVPAFRDAAAGVLRFMLPGRTPAFETVRAAVYVGGQQRGEPLRDARLEQPRMPTLVTNGSFEEGLAGWTVRPGRRIESQVVEAAPRSGRKCVRLGFNGKGGALESAEFQVTPHTLLAMEAWARVTSFERPKPHVGAPVRVLVELYDEAGKRVDRFSSSWSTVAFGERWRLVQAWRTAPVEARTGRVCLTNWWCKSTAYVDDIAVYVFTPPPCGEKVGDAQTR